MKLSLLDTIWRDQTLRELRSAKDQKVAHNWLQPAFWPYLTMPPILLSFPISQKRLFVKKIMQIWQINWISFEWREGCQFNPNLKRHGFIRWLAPYAAKRLRPPPNFGVTYSLVAILFPNPLIIHPINIITVCFSDFLSLYFYCSFSFFNIFSLG